MHASRSPIGWIEAAVCVMAIGALSLTYAVGHAWGAHPVAFILYAMLSSATALVLISGLGPDAMAIVRHPMSWLVGLSIILIEVFYFLTLTYVPPAHGNLVLRIGIPLALLCGWFFFRRRPTALGGVAAIVIVAATGFVVGVTAADVRWPTAAAGLLAAVFMVMRGFASEFHPWNRAAKTVHDKLRVTGLVVLVTSFIGLTLAALAAAAGALSIIPQLAFVPTLTQMKHVPTLLLGCVVGGAILTLMFYFNFSAVVKITTENLTAMMAFSPITAWAFQEIGVSLGLIAAQRPEARLIAAMAVMIASVLVMFWAGRRRAGQAATPLP